ncbi:MAG: hypothetical protein LAT66_06495 [Alkalimonas sp.]|nr:hypothetical protein [Alkalimonas sp.]
MQGTIIHATGTEIVIRGNDENKYSVALEQLKSELKPRVGDPVDFDVIDEQAQNVFILRVNSQVENMASSAKETASAAYKKVRSQINEENAEKIKVFTNTAASKASEIGKDFSSKASSALSDIQSGNVTTMNKYCLISLSFLILSGFFTIYSVFGISVNFYRATDNWFMIIFAIAAMAVAYLGVNAIVYRALTVITLLFVLMPAYEVVSFLSDGSAMMRQMGIPANDLAELLNEFVRIGLYLMIIATLMVIISLVPGIYTTVNKESLHDG